MGMDDKRVGEILAALGESLRAPTDLCLMGSAPAIFSGQQGRMTMDIDVWHPRSDYDAADLARACAEVGILYDPKRELEPDVPYLQIVRPGVVKLPREFETEGLARYGNLKVSMPQPEAIVAAKLTRGTEVDISDVTWWVAHRGLDASDVETMVDRLPDRMDRETASENMVFVRLVSGRGRK